jgi:uncharacterized protein YdhG (YjbR/CyaY superfamily)
MERIKPNTIDEHISHFPKPAQEIMEQIRRTIHKTLAGIEETISYQIPAFKQNGYLIYMAAYKNHIGLYPAPSGVPGLEPDMAPYRAGKATLRFPLDRPTPYTLIAAIVKHRLKENKTKKEKK